MKDYVPSTFKIVCDCGSHVTVRTKSAVEVVNCWNCGIRAIKVTMGYGKNNYRCYIVEGGREKQVRPTYVDQG